ncbi:MAG: diacylglycerol kinase family lipid kinase [Sphingomonas bacterium]|uniref:diacylglycerol/lipid kinase family protein n=1 Tax=Sphingomonas bacterium TaxID=1895847 RepID=UPI0026060003|nr:diacylglycerol kinase family protein [Sphingomonas bacterium]MDB5705599.1 diacylglycerol kinase family lipid kinase [Sphingomonas bacterium]
MNAPGNSITVIVNGGSGAAAKAGDGLADTLTAAFAKAGAVADIRIVEGDKIADTVREASKAGRIVVAGGDGTIAGAVQALEGIDCKLALLPLGTLNHLARDLGIPADLDEAAVLAVSGEARRIDLGTVNDIRFVNNASIGLYPSMVRRRDALRERHGWPKWVATIPAAWRTLGEFREHRMRLDLGEDERRVAAPLLFVGNNRYELDAGRVGCRASLSEGVLSVFVVAKHSRAQLIWFGLRAIVGRADPHADFVTLGDRTALTVEIDDDRIEIALDGELRQLASPLRFEILPGAMSVVCPPPAGSDGAVA